MGKVWKGEFTTVKMSTFKKLKTDFKEDAGGGSRGLQDNL